MIEKFNFCGISIAAINIEMAANLISNYSFNKPSHIAFPDAYVISYAQKDTKLRMILQKAWICMPDGKPSEILAKRKGFKNTSTVSGFHLLKILLKTNLTHYFYGSTPSEIKNLVDNLKNEFPEAQIIGFNHAPSLELDTIEFDTNLINDFHTIKKLKPNLLWIGISSPKQDYVIDKFLSYLDSTIFLGVGGVFDYISGRKNISPEWIKKIGFRWLFRLIKEPKRLYKKYLFVVFTLAFKFIKELLIKK